MNLKTYRQFLLELWSVPQANLWTVSYSSVLRSTANATNY